MAEVIEQKIDMVVEPYELLMCLAEVELCWVYQEKDIKDPTGKGILALGKFFPWLGSPEYWARIVKITDKPNFLSLRLEVAEAHGEIRTAFNTPMLCIMIDRRGNCPGNYCYKIEFSPRNKGNSLSFVDATDKNFCYLIGLILQKWSVVVTKFKLSDLPRTG